MPHHTKHPLAVAISFIDAINNGDVDRLATLMAPDFSLVVFDTAPQGGIDGWRGYATAYPEYLIHPHRMKVTGDTVGILGHTTGSHLGLPDEEEEQITLIWLAEVEGGKMRTWRLIEDNARTRREHGLTLRSG
ncbi:MAG: nuclear transport factor 2 family protein [Dehalococcoidia bacterium]